MVARRDALTGGTRVEDPDRALVAAAAAGDRGAFEALVLRHQTRIVNYAMAIVKNPADAEDAAQETFIRAYRSLTRFRGDSSFKTWLYTIATNAARTGLERRGRRSRLEDESLDDGSAPLAAGDVPAGGADAETTLVRRESIDRAPRRPAAGPACRGGPARRRGARLQGDRRCDGGADRDRRVPHLPRAPPASAAVAAADGEIVMSCDDVERAVIARAAGRLDPAGVERLEAHLDGCPACLGAASGQVDVAAVLSARPDAAPPPAFATRVMAHLDDPPTWLDVINWRRWTVRLAPVAAALLVVAAVGLGPAEAVEPIEFSDLVTDWVGADDAAALPAFSLLWQDEVTDDTLFEAVLTASPGEPF